MAVIFFAMRRNACFTGFGVPDNFMYFKILQRFHGIFFHAQAFAVLIAHIGHAPGIPQFPKPGEQLKGGCVVSCVKCLPALFAQALGILLRPGSAGREKQQQAE